MNREQVVEHLDQTFQKLQAKAGVRPTQIRVVSASSGLDYTFPAGSGGRPFHLASIGKIFTAVLVQRLAERGAFSIEDPLVKFFAPAELARLFVFKGVDYARQVTIEHLLGHTSGIADYFEGKTSNGQTLIKDVLENPDRHWTPQALIEFTRQNQQAMGAPGKVFNYSDTGYILLGQLIEKISGKSFDQNLADEIFLPLDMRDSYLMFFSEPANPRQPIQPIYFGKQEVSGYESLSCDWAGGGIVSTTDDLLKFSRALREGPLIRPEVLARMDVCPHKFQPGIYYGLGMMEIHFKDFFFLLGRLPKVKGHIGVLSTHLFYDLTTETHIVMNFGDTGRMEESFRALIEIVSGVKKL